MAWRTDATCDALLTDVRDTGFLPDASDQDSTVLLRFADKELRTMIAVAVEKNRGEHWLRYEDTDIVPGTTRYRIPRRCLGGAVRAVTAVDPNGVTLPSLTQVDPITLRSMFKEGDSSSLRWFAFEGDFVNLGAVEPSTGWTLRIHYVMRPSKLVVTSETEMATIYGPDSTTGVRILETAPGTNLTEYGAYLDIVRGTEPYDLLYLDRLSADTFAAPTFNFQPSTPIVTADIPSLSSPLHPGAEPAYLVQRDQTPLPPIPRALWDALVHGTCAQALEAVRDPQAASMRQTALAKLHEGIQLMGPRDQRNSQRILSKSPLRSSRLIRPRWSRT